MKILLNIFKWFSSVEVFPLAVAVEITWGVSIGTHQNGKENNQTKENWKEKKMKQKNILWIIEKMLTIF